MNPSIYKWFVWVGFWSHPNIRIISSQRQAFQFSLRFFDIWMIAFQRHLLFSIYTIWLYFAFQSKCSYEIWWPESIFNIALVDVRIVFKSKRKVEPKNISLILCGNQHRTFWPKIIKRTSPTGRKCQSFEFFWYFICVIFIFIGWWLKFSGNWNHNNAEGYNNFKISREIPTRTPHTNEFNIKYFNNIYSFGLHRRLKCMFSALFHPWQNMLNTNP